MIKLQQKFKRGIQKLYPILKAVTESKTGVVKRKYNTYSYKWQFLFTQSMVHGKTFRLQHFYRKKLIFSYRNQKLTFTYRNLTC